LDRVQLAIIARLSCLLMLRLSSILVRFTVVSVCLLKAIFLIFEIEFCVSHRVNFVAHNICCSGLGVLRRVVVLPFKIVKAADCDCIITRLYVFARALL